MVLLLLLAVGTLAAQEQRQLQRPNFGTADTTLRSAGATATVLSPMAAMLCSDLEALGRNVCRRDTALIERYRLVRQCNRYYVQAFVVPAPGTTVRQLRRRGVRCSAFAQQGATALIPVRRFVALTKSGLLTRIDVSGPLMINNIR